jgi:hypothetical protein
VQKFEFIKNFVHLGRRPIRFDGRPYLAAIYNSPHRRLVLRASRQVEKSTFLANSILHELAAAPDTRVLFVSPRWDQSSVFVCSRFLPMLDGSPILRRILLGKKTKNRRLANMRFSNDSELYVRAAFHNADSSRGISAQVLAVDEVQDLPSGSLAVLSETLSHAKSPRTLICGTPKILENEIETFFAESTANEWTIDCPGCREMVILDERCLGPTSVVCPKCQTALNVQTGRWVPRNPNSEWGDGYWINHLMVPWVNHFEILARQRTYDPAMFKNEVLGLPTTLGDHVVTRAELEACCTDRPMAGSLDEIPDYIREHVIVGIDWGGGRKSRTVVVIGYYGSDRKFVVARFERFRADEEPQRLLESVAALCRKFRVRWIGADGGGNGLVNNRLLLDQLRYRADLYGVIYSASDHKPLPDNTLWSWTVNRSASIGSVFSMVRKKFISFPRSEECGSFIDEIACELAEYDDKSRSIRYTHPENKQDDALHAVNFAVLVMNRWLEHGGDRLLNAGDL